MEGEFPIYNYWPVKGGRPHGDLPHIQKENGGRRALIGDSMPEWTSKQERGAQKSLESKDHDQKGRKSQEQKADWDIERSQKTIEQPIIIDSND